MDRSPILVASTLRKIMIYCKSVEVKSKCVCSLGPEVMGVFTLTIPDFRQHVFSTEGRDLTSGPNNRRHEKVDVKRVATEILENDHSVPKICFPGPLHQLWRPCMRLVDATYYRHLYVKCNFCTFFTGDPLAFNEYRCPHCSRDKWNSKSQLYIAQTTIPEQPVHSVWYRSAPTSYMITDDLISFPLPQHKELCHTSDFLSLKRRKLGETEECGSLSKEKVMEKLGKWEDLI